MCSWLEFEGVPSYVESRALSSGMESQFVVFVLKELAHRARWIVAQLPPTDAELDFLATGKIAEARGRYEVKVSSNFGCCGQAGSNVPSFADVRVRRRARR